MLVRCRVQGLGAEKLLNEARIKGLTLSQVRREADRALSVVCVWRDYAPFAAMAQARGFAVSAAQPTGLLRLLRFFARRWGLWTGCLLCAGLLIYAVGFIWQIRIEDAGAYAGEIRAYLEEIGVTPGLRRSAVSLAELRERLEWRLPRVKWVQTEYRGVALCVRLVEGTPPPTLAGQGGVGDVVAAVDGILLRLTVYAGTPQCAAGELVRKGQVLIRGEERGANGEMIPVKAQGEALARQWISAQAKVSLTETATLPTGRRMERRVLETPFFSWSPQETPEFLAWDVSRQEIMLCGAWLPLRLYREIYYEAALEERPRPVEEVKAEAALAAKNLLQKKLIRLEAVDKFMKISMIEGDTIVATATAEIVCDIARFQKNP